MKISSFKPLFAFLFVLILLMFASPPRAWAQTPGLPVVQNDFTSAGVINTQNLNATGTATAGSAILIGPMNNAGDMTIQVVGTYTGAISVQISLDGVNWVAMASVLNVNTGLFAATIPSATPGIYQVGVEGARWVQITFLAATTGSATVTARVSSTDSTLAIDTPIPAGTAAIGSVISNGASANGAAPSGNPVLQAGITRSTLPGAAVANNLTQTMIMSGDAQQVVHLNGDPANEWQATSGITALATNTSTAAKAAGAAGVRNYVTDIHVTNTSATVSTTFSVLDGATVIWTTFLPATTAALQQVIVDHTFVTPLKGTAATALNVQCGTTAASVFYNVGGFQNN